jgi:hypothetical protein
MHTHSAQWRDRRVGPLVMRALASAALLAAAIGPAWAGSDLRRGTDGALELQLPVGARGTALGGTVVADASGAEAIFWNPAGIASVERTEVLFTHTQYFADMKLNYAALAAKMGDFGVLGVSAKVLSIGDVIVTTEDAPDGTGEILTPTFSVLGISLAKQFTDRVLFGGTLNYVNESVASVSASGVAFDLGVQYVTDWHRLRFGMAMKNVGPSMAFNGPGFETNIQPPGSDPTAANRTFRATSASFEMPSFFTLSASGEVQRSPRSHLAVMGAFQNYNFTGDVVRGGAEWTYDDIFVLRGAWFGSFRSTVDLDSGEEVSKFSSGEGIYSGYSLGLGTLVRMGDAAHVGVDLAWRPVKAFFDDTIEMGLRFTF